MKMRSLEEPVTSQNQLMPRSGSKQRSIIADTNTNFA